MQPGDKISIENLRGTFYGTSISDERDCATFDGTQPIPMGGFYNSDHRYFTTNSKLKNR